MPLEPGRRPRGREELIRWGIIPACTSPPWRSRRPSPAPFYADPDSNAARQATQVREAGPDRGRAAHARRSAAVPQAFWFTGGTPEAGAQATSTARSTPRPTRTAVPVLVAYNVPEPRLRRLLGRRRPRTTRRWIDALRRRHRRPPRGGHRRAGRARLGLRASSTHLRRAVKRLHRLPQAAVYVDAGHSQLAARRHHGAPPEQGRRPTPSPSTSPTSAPPTSSSPTAPISIGMPLRDRHEPQRPGAEGHRGWCNPPGRGLGARPTTDDRQPARRRLPLDQDPRRVRRRVRATPRKAGVWWPRYALGLARRANPPLSSAGRAPSRGRRRARARDRRRAAAGRRPPRAGPAAAAP